MASMSDKGPPGQISGVNNQHMTNPNGPMLNYPQMTDPMMNGMYTRTLQFPWSPNHGSPRGGGQMGDAFNFDPQSPYGLWARYVNPSAMVSSRPSSAPQHIPQPAGNAAQGTGMNQLMQMLLK